MAGLCSCSLWTVILAGAILVSFAVGRRSEGIPQISPKNSILEEATEILPDGSFLSLSDPDDDASSAADEGEEPSDHDFKTTNVIPRSFAQRRVALARLTKESPQPLTIVVKNFGVTAGLDDQAQTTVVTDIGDRKKLNKFVDNSTEWWNEREGTRHRAIWERIFGSDRNWNRKEFCQWSNCTDKRIFYGDDTKKLSAEGDARAWVYTKHPKDAEYANVIHAAMPDFQHSRWDHVHHRLAVPELATLYTNIFKQMTLQDWHRERNTLRMWGDAESHPIKELRLMPILNTKGTRVHEHIYEHTAAALDHAWYNRLDNDERMKLASLKIVFCIHHGDENNDEFKGYKNAFKKNLEKGGRYDQGDHDRDHSVHPGEDGNCGRSGSSSGKASGDEDSASSSSVTLTATGSGDDDSAQREQVSPFAGATENMASSATSKRTRAGLTWYCPREADYDVTGGTTVRESDSNDWGAGWIHTGTSGHLKGKGWTIDLTGGGIELDGIDYTLVADGVNSNFYTTAPRCSDGGGHQCPDWNCDSTKPKSSPCFEMDLFQSSGAHGHATIWHDEHEPSGGCGQGGSNCRSIWAWLGNPQRFALKYAIGGDGCPRIQYIDDWADLEYRTHKSAPSLPSSPGLSFDGVESPETLLQQGDHQQGAVNCDAVRRVHTDRGVLLHSSMWNGWAPDVGNNGNVERFPGGVRAQSGADLTHSHFEVRGVRLLGTLVKGKDAPPRTCHEKSNGVGPTTPPAPGPAPPRAATVVPVGGVVSPSAPPAASRPQPENSKKGNLKKATNVPEGITEIFAVRGDELLSSGVFHLAAIAEPLHGSVQYVNEPDLLYKKLPETKQGKLIMDSKWTGTGYKSFRLESKTRFGPGTVILWDAERMPVGQGTWSAYWSTDALTWPNSGEIDMMEAVNMDTKMRSTLHTGTRVPAPCNALLCHGAGCPKKKHECEFNHSRDGCGGAWDRVNGKAYNDAGGALHAMSWTKKWVRMWLWERKDIPKGLLWSDVSELGKIADGTMEGVYAEWSFENGACDSSELLDHYFIINLSLCGEWAGRTFTYKGKNGWPACKEYIQNTGPKEWPPLNHGEFPHFLLNSIRLYKVPDLR